jgi:Mce-associated membrane protein
MEVALPRTTAGRPGVIESPATRRAILAVLVLVIVACLGTVAVIVLTRGTGDGLGDRLSSLQDDSVPGTDESDNREQLLTLSREFATRFNTYDESMLDDAGHLTDYAAVEDLMTPKFGSVFVDNVGYAEETVKQLGVASEGTVYAVGVASQDADSAEVLVAGTIELTYPVPEDQGNGDDETGDDPERLSTGPQRFRYQLSMVKIDGAWFVDDVDDVDDGLPPFSQPSIPDTEPTQLPSGTPPTTTPPSAEPTGEGEQ